MLPDSFGEANIQRLKKLRRLPCRWRIDRSRYSTVNISYLPRFCRFECGLCCPTSFSPAQVGFVPKRSILTALNNIQGGTQRGESRQWSARSHCFATRFCQGLRHAATYISTFRIEMTWFFVSICFDSGGITSQHHVSIYCEWIPLSSKGSNVWDTVGVPAYATSLYPRP